MPLSPLSPSCCMPSGSMRIDLAGINDMDEDFAALHTPPSIPRNGIVPKNAIKSVVDSTEKELMELNLDFLLDKKNLVFQQDSEQTAGRHCDPVLRQLTPKSKFHIPISASIVKPSAVSPRAGLRSPRIQKVSPQPHRRYRGRSSYKSGEGLELDEIRIALMNIEEKPRISRAVSFSVGKKKYLEQNSDFMISPRSAFTPSLPQSARRP